MILIGKKFCLIEGNINLRLAKLFNVGLSINKLKFFIDRRLIASSEVRGYAIKQLIELVLMFENLLKLNFPKQQILSAIIL